MAKVADKYLKTDAWRIIEESFDEGHAKVSESLFSLGNEYMGVRGYFEEGYSGDSLLGSYFNGVYERTQETTEHYRGVVDFAEYMVNSPDWLYTRISMDGEMLDLHQCRPEEYIRELDMRTGVLTRSFVWNTKKQVQLRLTFRRILSMEKVQNAAQTIEIEILKGQGELRMELGLDGGIIHRSANRCMWITDSLQGDDVDKKLCMAAHTVQTNRKLTVAAEIHDNAYVNPVLCSEESRISLCYRIPVQAGERLSFEKDVCNATGDRKITEYLSFEVLEETNRKWWQDAWEASDITISGDKDNQQGIRFCIFQLYQTFHGAIRGANIGAKGLTGEAYNGNAFWDTETYCLPFYLWNNREAARNLLLFRYKTLDEARARAKQLDCRGAFYPIATISGKECCNLWQHASLQLQASTAVAYGIWCYRKMYRDREFMEEYGLEMLVEISRMLASRGDYGADGKYGFYGVMGPDEFQVMVHNNCYTNYMGRFTLDFTSREIEVLRMENPARWEELRTRLGIREEEVKEWQRMAEKMYIPYDEKSGIFEQHEGFFRLPHVNIHEIPVEEFPLYNHWSYDRIYRNDMIKQPDVLMFMLLFNSQFSMEQLKANYEYYEPRCIHESSLSPSVHSILAQQLGKEKEAFDFFSFATRMDLDNYNRNTAEGIHTTSIAAAWMNIIYGFGGLRSDGEELSLYPAIPESWENYSFRLNYGDTRILIRVDKENVCLRCLSGSELSLYVYGKEETIRQEETVIPLQRKGNA